MEEPDFWNSAVPAGASLEEIWADYRKWYWKRFGKRLPKKMPARARISED